MYVEASCSVASTDGTCVWNASATANKCAKANLACNLYSGESNAIC